MNHIDEKVSYIKTKIQQTQIPDDLDTMLESKLNEVETKKSNFTRIAQYASIVVSVILLSLTIYNYQSLAYYSKKILGFDEFYGAVGILNEAEKGQIIDKTIELEEGLTFTVNGIMTDDNQLVLFYSFTAPDGLEQSNRDNYFLGSITGFQTRATYGSGISKENDLGTEEKGLYYYDAVHPMAKKLTVHLRNIENEEISKLTIPHDPNKAMKASLDVEVNESAELDTGLLTIDTLTASPSMTLLKGNFKMDKYVDLTLPLLGVKLVANGHTIGRSGYSSRHESGNFNFEIDYNPLPDDIEDLKVRIDYFVDYKEVNDLLAIKDDEKNITFHEENVEIKDISIVDDRLELTLITDEYVLLNGLSINVGGENFQGEIIEDLPSFQNSVKRTYQFNTDKIPQEIKVKGIYSLKNYDIDIDIPVK